LPTAAAEDVAGAAPAGVPAALSPPSLQAESTNAARIAVKTRKALENTILFSE
jgi:hypothetical protein